MDHGALTEEMLIRISKASELLVGDGVAPFEGGWKEGQPNRKEFVPYVVLADAGSINNDPTITRYPDFTANWTLKYFGVSRKQVEWIAGKIRPLMHDIEKFQFGSNPPYEVKHTKFTALGAVNRVDSTDPPFWQAFDTVSQMCMPKSTQSKKAQV